MTRGDNLGGVGLYSLAYGTLDGLCALGGTGALYVDGGNSAPGMLAGSGNGGGGSVTANRADLSLRSVGGTGSRGRGVGGVRVAGCRNSSYAVCLLLATNGTLDGLSSFLCTSSRRVNSCFGGPYMLTVVAVSAARGKCDERNCKAKNERKRK